MNELILITGMPTVYDKNCNRVYYWHPTKLVKLTRANYTLEFPIDEDIADLVECLNNKLNIWTVNSCQNYANRNVVWLVFKDVIEAIKFSNLMNFIDQTLWINYNSKYNTSYYIEFPREQLYNMYSALNLKMCDNFELNNNNKIHIENTYKRVKQYKKELVKL